MDPALSSLLRGRMGFLEVPDRFRTWTGGTAQALADAATEILAETSGPDDEVNERLVRYYVTIGLVDQPLKRGREALFGLRQLVQVVLARKLLVRDRLTQSQIRELFRTIEWDQVDGIGEKSQPSAGTEAQRLVAQFQGRPSPVQHVLASRSQRSSAQRIGSREPRAVVRWKLSPWCEVLADPIEVESLTDEQVDELGRALVEALTELRNRKATGGTP